MKWRKLYFLKIDFFQQCPCKVVFFFPSSLTFIPKDSFHQCTTKSFFYLVFCEKLLFPYGFLWPRACEPSVFVSMEWRNTKFSANCPSVLALELCEPFQVWFERVTFNHNFCGRSSSYGFTGQPVKGKVSGWAAPSLLPTHFPMGCISLQTHRQGTGSITSC